MKLQTRLEEIASKITDQKKELVDILFSAKELGDSKQYLIGKRTRAHDLLEDAIDEIEDMALIVKETLEIEKEKEISNEQERNNSESN